MKKITALILVFVCIFALAGCGNANKDNFTETNKEIKSITNNVKPDMIFPAVTQPFFEDKFYIYSFGYPISSYITVEYMDGTTENVCEALESGHIQITDLDKYNINYHKESKLTNKITDYLNRTN